MGVGKDMGVKLCFQKLNRAALDVDWSRKRHRWGDQSRSRDDRAKTWAPGEGDRNGKEARVWETFRGQN